MLKILNTLQLISPTLNRDTTLIIYFYYIRNKIKKLIKNTDDDLPFNLNCNLNKLYCYIYQLKIYNLHNYESIFLNNLKRFIKCFTNMYSFYDYDILNIYEKISLFKIKLIYNLLI